MPNIEELIEAELRVPYKKFYHAVANRSVPVYIFDFNAQGEVLATKLKDSIGKALLGDDPAIMIDSQLGTLARQWTLLHEAAHVERYWRNDSLKSPLWDEFEVDLVALRNLRRFRAFTNRKSEWPILELLRALRHYMRTGDAFERARRLTNFMRSEIRRKA